MWRVRGTCDATQLTGIQPIHLAVFAAVDDHVPCAAVKMTDHWLPARGTAPDAVARMLAGRERDGKRAPLMRAHRVNHPDEPVHVDQHAVTAWTTQQWQIVDSAIRQLSGTDRTQAGGLSEQFHVFAACGRLRATAAVIAHENPAIGIEPQRRAAIGAVGHEGIISLRMQHARGRQPRRTPRGNHRRQAADAAHEHDRRAQHQRIRRADDVDLARHDPAR
jgi:hypothetical protein